MTQQAQYLSWQQSASRGFEEGGVAHQGLNGGGEANACKGCDCS
jgi:hypothetical protein